MITIEAPAQPINGQTLDAELRAVAGAAYLNHSQGSKWPGVVRLHFADGTPQAVIDAVKAVYAAHDPAVKTRAQEAEAAREAAKEAVRTANVTALRTGLEARTGTVAQLQAQVAELAAVVEAMRVALGLDEPPDGRG